MKYTKILSTFIFFSFIITGCNKTPNSSSKSNNQTNISYLTSESNGTATIRIYKDNNSSTKERYIAPKNVKMKYSYNDLSGILLNNENVCPSIGNVNLLVIPVHIPGDNTYYNEEVRKDIEEVFFGDSYASESQLGFSSLTEYFYESSYGQLNFQGKVTKWFDLEEYK